MAEKEITKKIVTVIKEGDKIVQDVQRLIAGLKELKEQIKPKDEQQE